MTHTSSIIGCIVEAKICSVNLNFGIKIHFFVIVVVVEFVLYMTVCLFFSITS